MQFRMGSHDLLVERGRFVRPALARHMRFCTCCNTQAAGDERHYVVDCPAFQGIRADYDALFQESAGSMQLFMSHRDQKAVSGCLSAILNEAENMNTDPSS